MSVSPARRTLTEQGSEGERALETLVRFMGWPEPVREFAFWDGRKHRFDFAWPDRLLAVEIEGGTWSNGRHTRGDGFERDCEKLNEAALLGWRVLRFTPAMIEDGRALAALARVLG